MLLDGRWLKWIEEALASVESYHAGGNPDAPAHDADVGPMTHGEFLEWLDPQEAARTGALESMVRLGPDRLNHLARLYEFGRDRLCGSPEPWSSYADDPDTDGAPHEQAAYLVGKMDLGLCVRKALEDADADMASRRTQKACVDRSYRAGLAEAARLRDEFARDLGARPMKFSSHNVSRFLRLTGERPARVKAMRILLGELGLGHCSWVVLWDVFDHGEAWSRGGKPWALVGHPYDIDDEKRRLLEELARFGTLRVLVDDRPSYYGFGTHHVRVEVAEFRKPFDSIPSTRRTRADARAARLVMAETFPGPRRDQDADA